jgi:hypothetical protein
MRLQESANIRHTIHLSQIQRFNEAHDEAPALSIHRFHQQLNQARDVRLGVLGRDLRSASSAILDGAKVFLTVADMGRATAQVVEELRGRNPAAWIQYERMPKCTAGGTSRVSLGWS